MRFIREAGGANASALFVGIIYYLYYKNNWEYKLL